MDMLKVGRTEVKKGSKTPLKWSIASSSAFDLLKNSLTSEVELFQMDVDLEFIMRTDAREWAIGAVLEQTFASEIRPVAFYSRKLGGSQINWTPLKRNAMPL